MTLRVGLYPADRAGCGFYRISAPGDAVNARHGGARIELVEESRLPMRTYWADNWPGADTGDPPPEWAELRDVEIPPCDVVVKQRPLLREEALVLPLLQAAGVAVVVEIDDNFDAIERENVAWFASEPHWHHETEARRLARQLGRVVHSTHSTNHGWLYLPEFPGRHHRGWLHEAMRHCDLLTVSTPALAEHYGRYAPRVRVLRNCVPGWYLDVRHPENDRPVVGWTGTIQTHPKDLLVAGDAISQTRSRLDYELRIIGTGAGVDAAWGVEPDSSTGWLPIDEYPVAYAGLDVALCPLQPSAFNDAKSALKAQEAAALGAVPIMSPSREYLWLHRTHGIGLIARTPAEWARHIETLVTDHDLRRRMAAAGRDAARHLTLEANTQQWVDAWQYARDLADRRMARTRVPVAS